ncbi:MAG: methylmalonyl-CoA mutase, partial [Bacteroidales bacterium]|nr:methylmalonyl-CoA mutase [Bacteroidales bacterium]
KHSGELPIIGVNTFLTKDSFETIVPETVTRATEKEKAYQVSMLKEFHKKNEDQAPELLNNLKKAVLEDKNTFYAMMEAAKCCSLGQITNALYEVGGQYRRNM